MTKAEVRKTYLKKRIELGDAEWLEMNTAIYHRFFSGIDLSFIKNLHIFLSLEKQREPDTWQIIDRIRREFPGTRIIIPKVNEAQSLDHFYFEGLHQVKPNIWGIPEPTQGVPADISKIDMVVIPLLAVDRQGTRVGYGKGFYDKFLAQCRTDCRKIGLSLFEPLTFTVEKQSHDIPLDVCVTPTQVAAF